MKYWICLCLLTFFFSCKNEQVNTTTVVEENTVEKPYIAVYDYEGLAPLLAKQNDTIYVVNFWATWCKPCIKELPAFEKINELYANDKVSVVLVSLDFPEKLNTQIIPFIEKNKIASTVILLDDPDANSWIPKISEEWSGAIPATLIYTKGTSVFYERSFTFDTLEKEVLTFK